MALIKAIQVVSICGKLRSLEFSYMWWVKKWRYQDKQFFCYILKGKGGTIYKDVGKVLWQLRTVYVCIYVY